MKIKTAIFLETSGDGSRSCDLQSPVAYFSKTSGSGRQRTPGFQDPCHERTSARVISIKINCMNDRTAWLLRRVSMLLKTQQSVETDESVFWAIREEHD
ncbi:hypothetical protein BaRGS_00004171 [Batillaria attramentaria]|uniref:Uncharacterized protein n=1 Tax=Batillaria attramentaria TaxID=370345 RepID=A0ABD0LYS3_9CAEN